MPAGSSKTKQQASGSKTAPVTQEASPINEEVSPSGANVFVVQGFIDKKTLTYHVNKHLHEYSGLTKEQYVARAVELAQKPTGNGILGHVDINDQVIRYDTATNDFVKGHPRRGVIVMFKPEERLEYYIWRKREDLAHGGKI